MRWPAWLGVGERRWKKSPNEEVQPAKTAWDFLQLLIVPAILVAIALAFNASQASRERSREDRRIREDRALAQAAREDAILDAYLAKMSGLILERDLTSAKKGSAVRQVARTATLTTLRRLDGTRKGEVVRFLHEARLLRTRYHSRFDDWTVPVINLLGADLRGLDLADAPFSSEYSKYYVSLVGDLRGARFDHAELGHVDFGHSAPAPTDLRGASFNGADLSNSKLQGVNLRGASFNGARVAHVDFGQSDLRGTTFGEASIVGGTTFELTCLSNASFVGATFNLDGAGGRLPGTTTFTDAKGQDVDFSDAKNLSSVRLDGLRVKARFDGAKERPKMAMSEGFEDFVPEGCE